MKEPTQMGMNRTGIQMSPKQAQDMAQISEAMSGKLSRYENPVSQYRETFIQEADPIGTVPLPGTMKGAVSAVAQKLKGQSAEVLIDKLGERLAFERTGVRLYDALIAKCEALSPEISLDLLRRFRQEEAQHFELIRQTMASLGADPTAQTPCADTSAVASMGILQVLTDPRTSVAQCLEAVQIAELTDNDGWVLLIRLADEMGLDEMVEQFQIAATAEAVHLDNIRSMHESLVLAQAKKIMQ